MKKILYILLTSLVLVSCSKQIQKGEVEEPNIKEAVTCLYENNMQDSYQLNLTDWNAPNYNAGQMQLNINQELFSQYPNLTLFVNDENKLQLAWIDCNSMAIIDELTVMQYETFVESESNIQDGVHPQICQQIDDYVIYRTPMKMLLQGSEQFPYIESKNEETIELEEEEKLGTFLYELFSTYEYKSLPLFSNIQNSKFLEFKLKDNYGNDEEKLTDEYTLLASEHIKSRIEHYNEWNWDKVTRETFLYYRKNETKPWGIILFNDGVLEGNIDIHPDMYVNSTCLNSKCHYYMFDKYKTDGESWCYDTINSQILIKHGNKVYVEEYVDSCPLNN